MHKGFVFSTDAVFALILVLFLATSAFLVSAQGGEGLRQAGESIRYKVADISLMAFYQHKTPENIGDLGVIRFDAVPVDDDFAVPLDVIDMPADDTDMVVPFDDTIIAPPGDDFVPFPGDDVVVPWDGEDVYVPFGVPAEEVGLTENLTSGSIMGYCEVYPYRSESGVTLEKICKEVGR